MAERRMFAKTIIDSDAFLDMPMTAQLLYFHLSMRADDDGFINKPRTIMRMIGAKDDDMKTLLERKFVILFESGIVVIKHWRIHNYIQKDRYKTTNYKDEFEQLQVNENGSYSRLVSTLDTECIQDVSSLDTQVRLGKDRIGKDSIGKDNICAAPQSDTPPNNGVISLILNDKSDYWIYQEDIDGWKESYPAVDVMQELRAMKEWCLSNPTNRKTKTGARRFITNWLSRTQNSARPQNAAKPKNTIPTDAEFAAEQTKTDPENMRAYLELRKRRYVDD